MDRVRLDKWESDLYEVTASVEDAIKTCARLAKELQYIRASQFAVTPEERKALWKDLVEEDETKRP